MSEQKGPTRIFADTKLTPEQIENFGYMPPVEEIERKPEPTYEDCTLFAKAILPKRCGSIEALALPRADDREDNVALQFPDGPLIISEMAARNLVEIKNFLIATFDIAIDEATRRENAADRLEASPSIDERVIQEDLKVIVNDPFKARYAINRRVRRRNDTKHAVRKHRRLNRMSLAGLKEALEKQGLTVEDSDQGHD